MITPCSVFFLCLIYSVSVLNFSSVTEESNRTLVQNKKQNKTNHDDRHVKEVNDSCTALFVSVVPGIGEVWLDDSLEDGVRWVSFLEGLDHFTPKNFLIGHTHF